MEAKFQLANAAVEGAEEVMAALGLEEPGKGEGGALSAR